MNLPDNLPPLPPVPDGFDRWEYRGTEWKDARKAVYATVNTAISEEATADNWSLQSARPMGARWLHYIEAVRDPAKPSAQLFATPDPENVEESDDPADDHKDCRDGCRYSYEVGDGRQRVCPYGECQRNGAESDEILTEFWKLGKNPKAQFFFKNQKPMTGVTPPPPPPPSLFLIFSLSSSLSLSHEGRKQKTVACKPP